MSDLSQVIIDKTYEAVATYCEHTDPPMGGCECTTQAMAAVKAVLSTLVGKAFPDEDVDYVYACEELAQDAIDTLNKLKEN